MLRAILIFLAMNGALPALGAGLHVKFVTNLEESEEKFREGNWKDSRLSILQLKEDFSKIAASDSKNSKIIKNINHIFDSLLNAVTEQDKVKAEGRQRALMRYVGKYYVATGNQKAYMEKYRADIRQLEELYKKKDLKGLRAEANEIFQNLSMLKGNLPFLDELPQAVENAEALLKEIRAGNQKGIEAKISSLRESLQQ